MSRFTSMVRYHLFQMLLAALFVAAPIVLSGTFPVGVPTAPRVDAWERYTGRAERNGSRIAYELLVDPERVLLYTMTRYRIHRADKPDADDEILIWNSRPGARPFEPLRCFVRVATVRPGAAGWEWVAVENGTAAYRDAMAVATEVYLLHRQRERQQQKSR